MDAIRAALGEDEISYFGFSYGTQLGATWATLFPDTVRAAVLDGAIDPTTGRVQGLIAQAGGFERTLGLFLADCAADPTCPFNNGGDAEGAFDALLASLEQDPIPTAEGRPALVDGVFELGVAQALYAEAQWPELASARPPRSTATGRGSWRCTTSTTGGDRMARTATISRPTSPSRAPTIRAVGGLDAALAERPQFAAASRIGFTQAYELVVCASLPAPTAEAFEITGAGAGPIMVVGNTGDPATPYEGSRVMAETLEDGFFVSVEADTHTAYGLNACIDTAIEDYLVDLVVPVGELTC